MVPSAIPILPPSLKSGEPGRAAVCSVMTHNITDPCRETEIHVTSLCRGTGRFLNDPLEYCVVFGKLV